MLAVERIPTGTIQNIIEDNKIVVGKLRPKMEIATNGDYLKFFYDSPKIDTSTFFPKAKVFVANSEKLACRGIAAPKVTHLMHCPEESTWLVRYAPLPGSDLREDDSIDCLSALPAYLAELHDVGVYFRGMHLGNILRQGNGYALIDIAGMRIWWFSLNIWQRLRNVGRLLSFPEDQAQFQAYGIERFCEEYCEAANLAGWQRQWLCREVLTRAER